MREHAVRSGDGGTFSTQLGLPAAERAPAIVVVPHILGVDHSMLDAAAAYVAHGFIAVVPDVFWRILPGPLPFNDEGRPKARDRGRRVDVDLCVADLGAVVASLAALPQYDGRFGVVGYCFGGRYALLSAARLGAAAAVAFHGAGMREYVNEVPRVSAPVSFHFGDADPAVPMDEVEMVRAAFAGHANAEICVYPGVVHHFALPGMPGYDPAVERLAKSRALAVLDRAFA